MYGLPEDFDARTLGGRRLELVCFSENTVNLHFDGELHITIESAFAHQHLEPESENNIQEVPVSGSEIMQLLGLQVIDSFGTADGTLHLSFENGHRLQIFDTSSLYESYRIEFGDLSIVV